MESGVTKESHRNRFMGVMLVLMAACGFSAKAVLIKLAYLYSPNLDVITLLMLRMLIALPFFIWVAIYQQRKTKAESLSITDCLALTALGFLGYYLSSYLDFSGLKYISAGLERLLLFLYPTFVVLLSALFGRRFLSRHEVLALMLTYGGTALVFLQKLQTASPNIYLGACLVIGSAISFAVFLLISSVMIKRLGSARFTAFSMIAACLMVITHYLVQHGWLFPDLPHSIYWLTLLMALLSTVMPAFFMNAGIHHIGPGPASIISSAGPIGTMLLAYWVLGEAIEQLQWVGTVCVLMGVYVISGKK